MDPDVDLSDARFAPAVVTSAREDIDIDVVVIIIPVEEEEIAVFAQRRLPAAATAAISSTPPSFPN